MPPSPSYRCSPDCTHILCTAHKSPPLAHFFASIYSTHKIDMNLCTCIKHLMVFRNAVHGSGPGCDTQVVDGTGACLSVSSKGGDRLSCPRILFRNCGDGDGNSVLFGFLLDVLDIANGGMRMCRGVEFCECGLVSGMKLVDGNVELDCSGGCVGRYDSSTHNHFENKNVEVDCSGGCVGRYDSSTQNHFENLYDISENEFKAQSDSNLQNNCVNSKDIPKEKCIKITDSNLQNNCANRNDIPKEKCIKITDSNLHNSYENSKDIPENECLKMTKNNTQNTCENKHNKSTTLNHSYCSIFKNNIPENNAEFGIFIFKILLIKYSIDPCTFLGIIIVRFFVFLGDYLNVEDLLKNVDAGKVREIVDEYLVSMRVLGIGNSGNLNSRCGGCNLCAEINGGDYRHSNCMSEREECNHKNKNNYYSNINEENCYSNKNMREEGNHKNKNNYYGNINEHNDKGNNNVREECNHKNKNSSIYEENHYSNKYRREEGNHNNNRNNEENYYINKNRGTIEHQILPLIEILADVIDHVLHTSILDKTETFFTHECITNISFTIKDFVSLLHPFQSLLESIESPVLRQSSITERLLKTHKNIFHRNTKLNIFPYTSFYLPTLITRINLKEEYRFFKLKSNSILDYGHILPVDVKANLLRYDCSDKMKGALQDSFFIAMFEGPTEPYWFVEIRRDHFYTDFMNVVESTCDTFFVKQMKVIFKGEDGIDSGGIRNELFMMMSERMREDVDLFVARENVLWIRGSSFDNKKIGNCNRECDEYCCRKCDEYCSRKRGNYCSRKRGNYCNAKCGGNCSREYKESCNGDGNESCSRKCGGNCNRDYKESRNGDGNESCSRDCKENCNRKCGNESCNKKCGNYCNRDFKESRNGDGNESCSRKCGNYCNRDYKESCNRDFKESRNGDGNESCSRDCKENCNRKRGNESCSRDCNDARKDNINKCIKDKVNNENKDIEDLSIFEAFGKIIGIALYNDVILNLPLPHLFFVKLLEKDPEIQDLEEIEPEIYKSLLKIEKMDCKEIEEMGLGFEISYSSDGKNIQKIDLRYVDQCDNLEKQDQSHYYSNAMNREETRIQRNSDCLNRSMNKDQSDMDCINRSENQDQSNYYDDQTNREETQNENILSKKDTTNNLVTKNNVKTFIDQYFKFITITSISKQFNAIKKGFYTIIKKDILSIINPNELEKIIVGSNHIDINMLKKYTIIQNYTKESTTIKNFWEIVEEYSNNEIKMLLQFITGNDRVPVSGVPSMGITIMKNGCDTDRLPSASTCFKTLLLPEYSSKEKMKEKLGKAISMTKGFYLM